jgi:hypothetical protein
MLVGHSVSVVDGPGMYLLLFVTRQNMNNRRDLQTPIELFIAIIREQAFSRSRAKLPRNR